MADEKVMNNPNVIAFNKELKRKSRALVKAEVWLWRASAIFGLVYGAAFFLLSILGVMDVWMTKCYTVLMGEELFAAIGGMPFSTTEWWYLTLVIIGNALTAAFYFWIAHRINADYEKSDVSPRPFILRHHGSVWQILMRFYLNYWTLIPFCILRSRIRKSPACLIYRKKIKEDKKPVKGKAAAFLKSVEAMLTAEKILLWVLTAIYYVLGAAFGILLLVSFFVTLPFLPAELPQWASCLIMMLTSVILGVIYMVVAIRCNKVKNPTVDLRSILNWGAKSDNLVAHILFLPLLIVVFYIINYIRLKKNPHLVTLILTAQQNCNWSVPVTNEAVEEQEFDDYVLGITYQKERLGKELVDVCGALDPDCVLEVRHLRKCFPLKKNMFGKAKRELVAVDDVSFKLKAGETLGIVGESGCGKTTAGRAILKLHEPSGGQIIFDGHDITHLKPRQMRKFRRQMQIIFQDPYSSLPPRDTVGGLLSEPVQVHKIVPKAQTKEYVLELMDKCGLRDYYFERYPHEFSGGQRQRICIARALSVNPKLVICDEPVSALDVSIQAQIINLLKELQRDMNLAYVFISHDLSVVKFISDKIGVMYLGGMMEFGTKEDIFRNPLHPYTKALFSAVPNPDPTQKMERIALGGDIPSPANPPKGCRFHTRCPYAKEICKHVVPDYKEYEPGHFAACHLLEEEAADKE